MKQSTLFVAMLALLFVNGTVEWTEDLDLRVATMVSIAVFGLMAAVWLWMHEEDEKQKREHLRLLKEQLAEVSESKPERVVDNRPRRR